MSTQQEFVKDLDSLSLSDYPDFKEPSGQSYYNVIKVANKLFEHFKDIYVNLNPSGGYDLYAYENDNSYLISIYNDLDTAMILIIDPDSLLTKKHILLNDISFDTIKDI